MPVESSTPVTKSNVQPSSDTNSNKVSVEKIKQSLLSDITVQNRYVKDLIDGKIKIRSWTHFFMSFRVSRRMKARTYRGRRELFWQACFERRDPTRI